jgi:3-hydroxypropanoate dehydrogenase
MSTRLPDAAFNQLFVEARTHSSFRPDQIPQALLREMYETARWGPTAANSNPGRFLFLVGDQAKQKLSPLMSEGNRAKTLAAPVNVIMAYDLGFAQHLPHLFPNAPSASDWYADPQVAAENAFRGGTLQAAYLMIAARALGLDCGPMGGFDAEGVNEAFFAGTTWRPNFICNLGYGAAERLYPRNPRLEFDVACEIL